MSVKILFQCIRRQFHNSHKHFERIQLNLNVTQLAESHNEIQDNINRRKGVGNINLIQSLLEKINKGELSDSEEKQLQIDLQNEYKRLPNATHPDVVAYGDEPKVVQMHGEKPAFNFKPKPFADIAKFFNVLRMEHLGNFTGTKSYYLMSDLADLEQALIQYTTKFLKRYDFKLMSVPDILPEVTIEGCGMTTHGERTQVYRINPGNLCLSGTSEMALAAYFADKQFPIESLPLRVMAVSRCFRAETSGLQEEKGIFRVHQFTKVEMFGVCEPQKSEEMLQQFRNIEIDLFKTLGLHFMLLDMPPCELGAPAYRKYDIEAWLPGKGMFGEISSCSNCTDYQAKRLNIQLANESGFVHTLNGTACAVPRMMIALFENFQNADGSVTIPEALRKYMKKDRIEKRKQIPELKLVKHIHESF